ncbi:malate dehydrogenase [Oleiphilus sp. HI0081]|jgi:malate dehydrogenase (oxaloacetate-decarboxylating)(NADP+)|nr:malate dehydrogenase [Oleiphilus sp. HI0043]KZY45806.1 malate dehydrogenase [Oleiphilus sp. HI0050]KZY51993.1 malate dehydrogenase [Oleiphilus sp. HI0061]KZY84925.1 malate dehydrogenase [Oleiphilus sp. HI0069]KZY85618.1 malate dehydrogenase [Oleiphilus sp. HI0072]KZZ29084.1 malate dehydrogenase [Oleiphilus sp. HI0081]KZZ35473.1 malate dehydrogenase [Oleiphilus sp. HI0117]KZZ36414.1 malate dehydrogenase [Oleiphilus sp. HI0086]KZZ56732.1 malate dehydrogenase [Oleiphilus sp. HI0123]KZZ6453
MSDFKQDALDYHEFPKPGKISVELSTPAQTSRDLSLAYSPGVAEPVKEIAADPENAYKYTAKGNLVAVITDGTAILGLGDLGPLASKPVMEGKSLLFKRFAGVDSIDIEVESESPQAFIDTVRRIAITFGGINLEDIKAPECFEIERTLKEQCNIPVFHDDQHGTAIVTVAGALNALEIQGKKIEEAKMAVLGAGAAAISCSKLLTLAGMKPENIFMCDRKGVIHSGRDDLNQYKAMFAVDTDKRTFDDALDGADIFLGLSGPDMVTGEQIKKMAPNPIIFACANPVPEIMPEVVAESRPDAVMATGRSDYPNQVNNVLGFPFIFRGALDVRATAINEEMKLAAAKALANLAKEPVTKEVLDAYGVDSMEFGKEYIIPKATDSRLLGIVSTAVAQAAIDTGAAEGPLPANYPLKSLEDI